MVGGVRNCKVENVHRAYLSLRLVLVLVDFCGMPIVNLNVSLEDEV